MYVSGCSAIIPTVTTTATATVTVTPVLEDNPYLSSQEVIAVAKKHALNSPDNALEKIAVFVPSTPLATPLNREWKANYLGNSKWDVILTTNQTFILHWTVFENNLAVIFVGRE
jgi:hypothetical protein